MNLTEPIPPIQSSQLRVLIVDDHELARLSLKVALQNHSNVELVGVASDGQEAVEIAAAFHPDVIILDLQMPIMDGATASRQIKYLDPDIKIIGYSCVQSSEAQKLLDAAMLDAFCDKATHTSDLVCLAWRLTQGHL